MLFKVTRYWPNSRNESKDVNGYMHVSCDVEAPDAVSALMKAAPKYIGRNVTSRARKYGGTAFLEQAHSQSNRAGRVGAEAVAYGFEMNVS